MELPNPIRDACPATQDDRRQEPCQTRPATHARLATPWPSRDVIPRDIHAEPAEEEVDELAGAEACADADEADD